MDINIADPFAESVTVSQRLITTGVATKSIIERSVTPA